MFQPAIKRIKTDQSSSLQAAAGMAREETRRIWLGLALIASAGVAAYANSLSTPFVFDDFPAIIDNPTIRTLWPPWQPLIPPEASSSAAGRPIVNLSFAINYAIGGTEPWGYHLFNLCVHITAAMALFGIVRRTLALAWAPIRLRASSLMLGFATALLWVVHPLQTESVTFVVQRTESLAGLIYLAGLYCFVRAIEPSTPTPRRWFGLCGAACFFGVATKEIFVSFPLLLLLFDRTFVAGSFARLWQVRRWFHGALLLSWIPLGLLIFQAKNRGGTAVLELGASAWISLMTQCQAVVTYLKLSIWPHPLVIDYGNDIVVRHLANVLPQAFLLTTLAGLTVYAVIKRSGFGFIGAWFFIILAPSSSVVPLISQVMAEHRMYLPLAAVVLLGVLLIHRVAGRGAPICFFALALAGIWGTAWRNHDYRSAVAIWSDTADRRPNNARAHYNLGVALTVAGDKEKAKRAYVETVRLDPEDAPARTNLAELLLVDGQIPEARIHAEAAVRLDPTSAAARRILGNADFFLGERAAAMQNYEAAVRLDPQDALAHNALGFALASNGSIPQAISHYRRAIASRPDLAAAHHNLGQTLLRNGQVEEAIPSLEAAVRLAPNNPDVGYDLGNALLVAGRFAEAVPYLQAAVTANPKGIQAYLKLGYALERVNRSDEAAAYYRQVLQIDPKNREANAMLAAMDAKRGN